MNEAGSSSVSEASRAAWASGWFARHAIPAFSTSSSVVSNESFPAPKSRMIPRSAGSWDRTSRILATCASESQKMYFTPAFSRMYWHSLGRFDW